MSADVSTERGNLAQDPPTPEGITVHPDRLYAEEDLVFLLGLDLKDPGRALTRAGIPHKKIGGKKYFTGRAVLKFFGLDPRTARVLPFPALERHG